MTQGPLPATCRHTSSKAGCSICVDEAVQVFNGAVPAQSQAGPPSGHWSQREHTLVKGGFRHRFHFGTLGSSDPLRLHHSRAISSGHQ